MPPAINLVCTRCTDGNHAALQRWYNDHAQLLMASEALRSAELYQLESTTAAIDYFCLYHFDQLDAFEAFDSGDVMSHVRELSQAAPGRSSIDIVKRTQYERVLHRRWNAEQGISVQASLLSLESASLHEATRWLNDVLYGLHLQQPLQSAQVYAMQQGKHSELFVLLETSRRLPTDWHAQESIYAARADLRCIWQMQARRIAAWLK
ncbi:hypothetical protein [Variovorax sp. PCZ-1]|uniref:hypothetical protein n=1 Tax=Variovorax sp. PCZ-1 TaxID=2835533 RepID=UPI001BCE709F|nr:hypothetical protein [Variovorax sp. PCZ-1]MBS7807414.1 hypothetical protein [Variovorax sp. PCZ-1]